MKKSYLKYIDNMETTYTPIRERRGCIAMFVAWFAMLILGFVMLALGGCKSVQYVPVKEEIHDTVRINKTDTVNHYEVKTEKEFVYVKDSSSVMVDNDGKVLKNEIWHNKTIIREKSDSIAHYKALVDSLMAVKQREVEVPVIIEKPLTKWEQRFITIGKVSMGVYVGLLLAFVLWLINWIKKKRK